MTFGNVTVFLGVWSEEWVDEEAYIQSVFSGSGGRLDPLGSEPICILFQNALFSTGTTTCQVVIFARSLNVQVSFS